MPRFATAASSTHQADLAVVLAVQLIHCCSQPLQVPQERAACVSPQKDRQPLEHPAVCKSHTAHQSGPLMLLKHPWHVAVLPSRWTSVSGQPMCNPPAH